MTTLRDREDQRFDGACPTCGQADLTTALVAFVAAGERSLSDAPPEMRGEVAGAWASGWNAAVGAAERLLRGEPVTGVTRIAFTDAEIRRAVSALRFTLDEQALSDAEDKLTGALADRLEALL